MGDVVHKMGRVTGHTYGSITNTCYDMNPLEKHGFQDSVFVDKKYPCQMIADVYIQPGDSGGPVFINSNGSTILAGISWAMLGNTMVFSPIDGVHFDLGPLVTYSGGSVY